MSKVNSFLTQRLKNAGEKLSKMAGLAELSSSGNLSSFAGVFRVSSLSEKETSQLEQILEGFKNDDNDLTADFRTLAAITSEVKAINNQAAILHGERIKRAQEILKRYRDGAFSAWLVATYGNRQTPYNFLQYYELHLSLPQPLQLKLDEMPRQAVYTLASRSGEKEKKEEIIRTYQGEPKQQLLMLIRDTFPLSETDKRGQDFPGQAIATLAKLNTLLKGRPFRPTPAQKDQLRTLLSSLSKTINDE
jgi:hypothetical protein